MSLHDYEQSIKISVHDHPFYALIMAAMRQADSDNVAILREAFPEVWNELQERYYASGGLIGEEVNNEKI